MLLRGEGNRASQGKQSCRWSQKCTHAKTAFADLLGWNVQARPRIAMEVLRLRSIWTRARFSGWIR